MEKRIVFKPIMVRSEEGDYIICDFNNKGGAIISDKDPFMAMEKFMKASELACVVMTLNSFKEEKCFYKAEFIW